MRLFKRDGEGERGVVSMLVLAVFLVLTVFFYSTYRIVLFDYAMIATSSELKGSRIQQANVAEVVRSFYGERMLNDVPYEKLKYSDKIDKNVLELFKADLANYGYKYVDPEDKGIRKTGRFDWLKFINYDTVFEDEREYRIYPVRSNWDQTDDSGVYDSVRGSLLLPDKVNIKVNFEPGVTRLNMIVGSAFEEREYDLINRNNVESIFEITDLPRSVDYIKLEADGDMGSTSFEILRSREIDVLVYQNDVLGSKEKEKELGVLKTLRVELGKYELNSSFVNVGSE